MNPPADAIEAATRLLGASPVVNILEAGSQANAWLLSRDNNRPVLRVAKDHGDLGLIADLRIRNALAGFNFVPCNRDSGQTLDGKAWLIDEYVSGRHPDRGGISETTTRQIGIALGDLHQLPVSGWGQIEPRESNLCGSAKTAWEGLFTRFDLGLDRDDLDATTRRVLSEHPKLSSSSATLLKELKDVLTLARPAVCHTDLHEKQIFVESDNLSGDHRFREPRNHRPLYRLWVIRLFPRPRHTVRAQGWLQIERSRVAVSKRLPQGNDFDCHPPFAPISSSRGKNTGANSPSKDYLM